MYQQVAPIFLVEDVDEAVAWYADVLEAKLQYSLPQTPPFEWVSLLLDGVEIMLARKEAAQRWYSDRVALAEKPANVIAYIYVQNVNGLHEQIKDKAEIIMEPTDQRYNVRELAIQDPSGFTLIFAQVLEQ